MKLNKDEMIKHLMEFVNYHDGGYIEAYVAVKLIDHLVNNFDLKLEEDKDDDIKS